MNNLQNSIRKFVHPPKAVPDYSEPHVEKKDRKKEYASKFDRTRPSGTLKIFLESENVKKEDSVIKLKAGRRKIHRDFHQERALPEEKVKRREARRSRKQESVKIAFNKPNYFNLFDSNVLKNKQGKSYLSDKTDKKVVSRSDLVKLHEPVKKTENLIVNSLFTLRKDIGESGRRSKTEVKSNEIPIGGVPTQKSFGRISQGVKPEVKTTISDYKKIHINEILKGHAQKVQTTPSKSGQINSFQGVTELLQKIKNIQRNDVKGKPEEEKKKEEKKDEDGRDEAKIAEVRDVEEKRKVPDKWLNSPQSNELERRLKPSGQETKDLFPYETVSESGEEDELSKVSDDEGSEKSEEKKSEKRTTYIDRVAMRTFLKEKVTVPPEVGDGTCEPKKSEMEDLSKVEENSESLSKKFEDFGIPRSIEPKVDVSETVKSTSYECKDLTTVKDSRHNTEQIFKAKPTRSAELRDLVTQAIKEHKIFCIFDNHWYIVRPVREELLSRGWLEVIPDRRLIPRRRPPPMGPTYDRDKTLIERNCNTIEAILTAKENFADEIQETVSKSSSFKVMEKPKTNPETKATPIPSKKASTDSLTEVLSQFRIIPPTSEKKKNNFEIREFVTKYHNMLEKEKEKDRDKDKKGKDKEKDKNSKKKSKTSESNLEGSKGQKNKGDANNKPPDALSVPTPLTSSLQAILDSISDNKKSILQATIGLRKGEGNSLGNEPLNLLYSPPVRNLPSIESKEALEKKASLAEKNGRLLYSEAESKMISKIIQSSNARIHFMWLSIKPAIHLKCFNYSPEIVNKFQKTTFCTKIGLWNHLNNIQWYAHEVNFPAKSPRMYNTGEADDLQAFFQDFQLTACIGMLKWLSDTFYDRGIKAVQTKKGKVPLKAFEFAIKQCERYVRFRDNEDLSLVEEPKVLQEEWNTFLQWFYIITNDHGKVQESSSAQLMVVYTKAVETLRTMKRHWPEIDIDGRLNIWIMKPYCASCGRGIFMTNNVYYIGQHSKYIVQKYIERPLLIYNTKFDIRQWFLITKLTPLEIWMYKECYLRFCTQPFALRNLHESVHLSNNSVQRKYVSFRDPGLPDQNMWDSNTFQLYLKTIGYPNAWNDIIYPGMRDAIVSTMLAAQDTFDGPRRSWFEVYGADFMLSANVKDGPWLIEINENPAMDPSTKVTGRMCPQMLRDVIKVIVDKRSNKNASTGQWELVYRQNYSPSFGTVDLDVKGRKIARVPTTVKLNFNLPQHPNTSPANHRRGSEDSESKKLYEVVKSYGSGKNSKSDTNEVLTMGKSRDKERTTKDNKIGEKEVKKAEVSNQSDPKLKRDKFYFSTSSTLNFEDKSGFKNVKDKKDDNDKGTGKTESFASNLKEKDTSTTAFVPEKQKQKRMHNTSSLSDTNKCKGGVGKDVQDGNESGVTSDMQFLAAETKKSSASQNPLNSHIDKFKFTKFYKV